MKLTHLYRYYINQLHLIALTVFYILEFKERVFELKKKVAWKCGINIDLVYNFLILEICRVVTFQGMNDIHLRIQL